MAAKCEGIIVAASTEQRSLRDGNFPATERRLERTSALWVHFMVRIGREGRNAKIVVIITGTRTRRRSPRRASAAGHSRNLCRWPRRAEDLAQNLKLSKIVEHRHALAVLLVTMASRGEAWGKRLGVSLLDQRFFARIRASF